MSITILDENDNSPQFDITSDTSVSIPENTAMGKKVAVVLGRDRDAGLNGLVRVTKDGITWLTQFTTAPFIELHLRITLYTSDLHKGPVTSYVMQFSKSWYT